HGVLALPSLLLPRLDGCDLERLSTLMTYGDRPRSFRRPAHERPRTPSLRFLPATMVSACAGPALFEPFESSSGGWRLVPLPGPYPVPLLLSASDDLADDRQAARLHLLVDGSAVEQSLPTHAARFARHPDLYAALAHHRLVDTGCTVVRRDSDLHCEDPGDPVDAGPWRPAIGAAERFFASQAEVAEVACVVRRSDSAACLTAYVRVAAGLDRSEVEAELRRRLRQALPHALHPDMIAVFEHLPLDAEGRLAPDRLPLSGRKALLPTPASPGALTDEQSRLTAIWREVLSVPEVGPNDDFFELGGDSILAAVIVSKASTEGLYLRPKDLFEHPTVAALAQVVSHSPQVDSEQGPVTGEVVLGPTAAWFFDKVEVEPSHFNQALLVGLREAPDPALMKETLRALARQHDVLRSRFVRRDGGWHQHYDDESSAVPARWREAECSNCTGRIDHERWLEAIGAAQSGLDIERGPLWALTWLQGPTLAESRLLLVAHHLVIDGISWSILLQDLSDTYLRLKSNAGARLPLKTSSAKAWTEAWRSRLSRDALRVDRDYWQAFPRQVQQARAGGSRIALMQCDLARARRAAPAEGSCVITLDRALTEAFRTAAHGAYRTDANDLLVAALHAGFHAWAGASTLLLDLEGHGRDPLDDAIDLSRSIGWFTSIYPVLLQAPSIDRPDALIKYVKQRLHEVPNKGAGYGVLLYMDNGGNGETRTALSTLPDSPVLFTYLGQLDQLVGNDGLYAGTLEPAPGIRSARQRLTHLVDLCAYIASGHLTLECRFEGGAAVDDSMGCLMQHIEQALIGLIRHCCDDGAGGLTPSDVPEIDLDQDTLDALLEEVAALEA
ncbi:MAG: condensation domain-containing protein, partial [Rhizobacter sp.]